MRRTFLPIAAVALVAAVLVAGCGSDDKEAAVSFTSPENGASVKGDLTANVKLENFDIDAANVGKENAKDMGHVHFSLDGGKFDKPKYSGANGELAVQLGVDGQYSPATEPTITYKNIPAGEHTLKVELVNNDHSETGKEASIKVNVEGGSGSASFDSPREGSTVGSEFTAEVALASFEIDAKNVGKKKKEGTGHLHFSLDGGKFDKPKYSGANGELAVQLGVDGKYSPSTEPSITYKGIPAGDHVLKIELANNDHSPTGSEASTNFTVR